MVGRHCKILALLVLALLLTTQVVNGDESSNPAAGNTAGAGATGEIDPEMLK